jgi:hypothetical protein
LLVTGLVQALDFSGGQAGFGIKRLWVVDAAKKSVGSRKNSHQDVV